MIKFLRVLKYVLPFSDKDTPTVRNVSVQMADLYYDQFKPDMMVTSKLGFKLSFKHDMDFDFIEKLGKLGDLSIIKSDLQYLNNQQTGIKKLSEHRMDRIFKFMEIAETYGYLMQPTSDIIKNHLDYDIMYFRLRERFITEFPEYEGRL